MSTAAVMRSKERKWLRRSMSSSSRCVEISSTLVINLITTGTCFSLATNSLYTFLACFRSGGGIFAYEEDGTTNDAHQLL